MRILLIEDEAGIVEFVRKALQAQGHQVDVSGDGPEGERRALTTDVDLVILDRMLPGREGVEVLRGIRAAKPDLPVVMLTAIGEVGAKVQALDAGATDYVTKPFSVDELLARVRAHLRRPSQPEATRLRAAGIEVDLLSREVQRDEEAVRLSAKEFELLVHFMRHPNQVLSREQLLSGVWGYDFQPQTNVVEVYVGYLRKKLGRPDRPAPIDTIRSAGYRFTVR
ncbi:MAG: two-component system, OmpR family, response regulator [Solirubrobacteraceae bacterium]|nr:two-component system, OmpR family, response regulator [Solirubrobacteraceae bacterium]MEA2276394.1 two-component system, OmpR family, response regulator [Solirubrobacteraceae bacterium]MEA2356856.1 two-component system, OmpR family, response regulator [Solirubrobacteraceae bacterium]MEA2392899.1 two-component system, OmpR family, response regulator [Solirubrobacteraceae bacterium]